MCLSTRRQTGALKAVNGEEAAFLVIPGWDPESKDFQQHV
jgi:hypothetical protein